MNRIFASLLCLTFTANLFAKDTPTAAASFLKNPQVGKLVFKGAGNLHSAHYGLLLVGEQGGSIVAIDTGDRGVFKPMKAGAVVTDLGAKVAGALGAKPGGVKINDLAVNPETGTIYLTARRSDGVTAVLTVNAKNKGQVAALDTDKMKWVRVKLSEKLKISRIADLGLAAGRLLAAGQSNDAFRSKIFSLSLPLVHGSSGEVYSTDTYHVAHGRWETRAPIQSFILTEEAGTPTMVGSFACTPIAKFPLANLEDGAQVKGTSIMELGSGNRPLDMFIYSSNGKQWLVTHTMRFHKPFEYTPSKYWGVRVDMKHIAAKGEKVTNKNAVRRDKAKAKDPKGVEVIPALHGALQVDKFGDQKAALLREEGGKLNLAIVALP
ncbi:MAG: hypothetical protein VX705_11045 [Verrucomicrobiota bacterium]|nr:hypothetical protein [Verrucomicrobiota bacterium]